MGRLEALYRRLAGDTLTAEEQAAFDEEGSERDIRRVRVLAAIMLAMHATHVAMYYVPEAMRAGVPANLLRWKDNLVLLHALTAPFALAILAVCFFAQRTWVGRHIAPLAGTVYLVHGALATSLDQIAFPNLDAFTGYAFGIAIINGYSLRTTLWIYGIGTLTVVLGIAHFQEAPALRLRSILNIFTTSTITVALNVLLHGGRRRDFRQRRTIAHQRDELASLNADLERRVDAQVAEIVRRAEEANNLNAQLQSQIRERSNELQAALARLAAQREEEGVLRPGAVLGDRFEIRGKLGAGGMGVVYSGRDQLTNSSVAIKVIRPGDAIGVDAMRRFLGEAGVVAAVSHPAVVKMISVDVSEDGCLYQAQELLDGRPLDEREEEGPWPEAEVARLGSVLCDALAAAHERGIVHRDVKPSNVMLIAEEPGLKLLDFGLAKLYDDPNRNDAHRTGSRLVVGTPAYMAPEQVVAGEVTAKADVYAVGVVLFQLLTGKLAFEVEGASRIMMQHVSTDAPDVRTLRPEVRGELASMIASCLSKQAVARPTARELSTRLGGFADAYGAPSMQEIGERNCRKPAPADPAGRTTASIARRMRGLASSLILAALLPRV